MSVTSRTTTSIHRSSPATRRPRMTQRMYCRNGFTLMELIIAIGILAILGAIIIPAAGSSGTASLESIARVVAADLRLAREQAIQFNTDWTVEFDFNENAYELVHTGSGSPPALENPLASPADADGTYRVDLDRLGGTTTRNSAVRLASVELSGSGTNVTSLTFGPLGGTGPSRNEDTIVWLFDTSSGATRRIKLTVSWVTGQVWIDPVEMAPQSDS